VSDLRTLLRGARAAGWAHVTYGFGTDAVEHAWERGPQRISLFCGELEYVSETCTVRLRPEHFTLDALTGMGQALGLLAGDHPEPLPGDAGVPVGAGTPAADESFPLRSLPTAADYRAAADSLLPPPDVQRRAWVNITRPIDAEPLSDAATEHHDAAPGWAP
jgi:hypothetical protein